MSSTTHTYRRTIELNGTQEKWEKSEFIQKVNGHEYGMTIQYNTFETRINKRQ